MPDRVKGVMMVEGSAPAPPGDQRIPAVTLAVAHGWDCSIAPRRTRALTQSCSWIVRDEALQILSGPGGLGAGMPDGQLTGGFGLLFSNIKFDPDANTPVPGNDGAQQGGVAPIAGLYYSHDLHEP
jgi:hypothetical protein